MNRLYVVLACLVSLTVSGQDESPEVTHVGMVAPTVVGITIQAGRVEYGRQVPYVSRPGDTIEGTHHITVKRDGKFLGWMVGRDRKLIYTEDRVVGRPLDTSWMDDPRHYRIEAGKGVQTPVAVYRKSKPSDFARWNGWPYRAPVRHIVYLKLPEKLPVQSRCAIDFGGKLKRVDFVCDPAVTRSEAVHVSHLGFRPDDPAKVAFLSCWMGSGGDAGYGDGLTFTVRDARNGEAFRGDVKLSKRGDDRTEDAYQRNYSGVDVWIMDFSPVRKPGTYRVCVEGIGCSYPFEIGPDVWKKAFTVSARGFYHQRSGIELGPPYTTFKRPRCFHPDDGVKVLHSTCPLMDSGNGLNAKGTDPGNFGNLVKGRTDRVIPDAWGAYMDAGDWDRRIQHLIVSRYLIDLAEQFPAYFKRHDLNIPESGNDLPDVVDEALFNLDGYRRLQTKEGGIRGGIESSEHPRHGECSWQESLDIMAYAPGVWSSYVYAGAAAQAAHCLSPLKPGLAEVYRESALRAMAWAEKHHDAAATYPHAVRDERNLAAAELFRLTGETRWHELFLETTVFTKPGQDLYVWKKQNQQEAPWVYCRTKRPGMKPEIVKHCREAVLREADNRVRNCAKAGFRWAKYEWQPGQWGAFSAPDGVSLVRAHVLTGDETYLRTLVLACQAGAGANPVNLCYTTGMGHASPLHPLHIDSRLTHQPPPPGLTVGGPIDVARHKDYWAQKIVDRYCFPKVDTWPTLEAFWDVFWYPPLCEFTVHSPMAPNAYAWGYLAARKEAGK